MGWFGTFRNWLNPNPQPSASEHRSRGGYSQQRHSSLNPVNKFDLAARSRASSPQDLLRSIGSPSPWLHVQSGWRRAEYYQELSQSLRLVNPESVGLEPLLEARIVAACRSTREGQIAEMRALRSLVADLQGIGNAENQRDGWKTRKQARHYVARRLTPMAQRAIDRGETEVALEALRAIEDTGAITPSQLKMYAGILRRTAAVSDPTSLRVYLMCLEQHRWHTANDLLLEEIQKELSKHLSIDELTPQYEIAGRMALIARMHAGGGPVNGSAKHVGLGYLRLEQPERAIHYLERASQMDGHDHGETWFFLAQSFYATKQHDRASETFAKAVEQGYPQSRIAGWQGLALAKSEQWDAAYEVFRVAEQNLGPEADSEFFLFWARTCYRKGDVGQSKARYRQAIDKARESKPEKARAAAFDRTRAQYGLAVCQVHEGDLDGAMALLKDPNALPDGFAPAAHLLGWLFEKKEQHDHALLCYRAAVKANPGDLVYVLSLALRLTTIRISRPCRC